MKRQNKIDDLFKRKKRSSPEPDENATSSVQADDNQLQVESDSNVPINSVVVVADSKKATTHIPDCNNKPYHPDSSFKFPTTIVRNQKRSCQRQWFKNYPWLDYCIDKDSVTCFVCKRHNVKGNLSAERCKEDAFIEIGFKSWKKALERFEKHQTSNCHRAAAAHEVVIPHCGDVVEMINENTNANRALSRRCFITILESLQYLARQGIPLRGHGDDSDSNFIQLLLSRCKSMPELKNWLDKKQGKFVTHDVQNEILQLMSNSVLRNLLETIRGNVYSIMCDEYTDISNKELLTFCIRWVDESLDVYEKFLGFYEIPDIKSATIVAVIKDILARYRLSLDALRGQCYDGASNMLGKSSGVAVQLQAIQPRAPYTHCHAHSLSLSVKDVTKSITILRDTMGTAGEIIILIKFSPKRENLLGKLKDQIESDSESVEKADSISKLSETRWTVRANCFKRILDNYDPLMAVWEHCLQNGQMSTDVKSRIIGVMKQMKTFDFFFGLNIGHRLFSHTDNLSKTLQAERMSANDSKKVAELVVSVLENMRNEESFNLIFDAIETKAKNHAFVEEAVLARKRKTPNYSILEFIEGHQSNERPHHPGTPQ